MFKTSGLNITIQVGFTIIVFLDVQLNLNNLEKLSKSCFNDNLFYNPKAADCDISNTKKCKGKVIWFNLSFSLNVQTNVGEIFLKVVKRHFPKENLQHKIFNKNMLKINYSCTINIIQYKHFIS